MIRAVPVGDHEAIEAPLAAQHVGEEPLVLCAVHAVESVVGGHDAERTAFAYGQLERDERDLAQRALVDDGVDRHALELGVVGGEVLHRGRDTL